MTALLSVPPQQSSAISRGENRVLLTGIQWETYNALVDDLGECNLRLTYNDGSLEIMTLSFQHESFKTLLGRLFEMLTFTLHIPIRSLGSTTLKPEHIRKGLEPDECYYVRNEAKIRGKSKLDFDVDPSPDLAIEVDISHSSINRLLIYAALGIAEVWRYDGQALYIHHLQNDGTYVLADHSLNLPDFPVREIARFLAPDPQVDETSLMWSFVDWVREVQAGKVKENP